MNLRVVPFGVPGAPKKFDRTGRPSITKTERPRSANLPQMPRGLMCRLRPRGRGYGGPAGFRWIDPPLQPPPCGGRQPVTGELAILANTVTLLLIDAEKKAIVLRWSGLASTPTGEITQRFQSRFPASANGSRECAPDDRLREMRDRAVDVSSRIALRSIRATRFSRDPLALAGKRL